MREMIEQLSAHEETMIDLWLQGVEKRYPGLYNLTELRKNGASYFPLIIEVDTILENHPCFSIIPRMCQYHVDRDTPLEHLLSSSYIWREAVLTGMGIILQEKNLPAAKAMTWITAVNVRIDDLQSRICQIYWESATRKIQRQQDKIRDLHQDRLSLLGKMAASMAHEIRNPLTAIEGFIALIRKELSPDSSDKVGRYIHVMSNELQNLHRHISGFLSFSKNGTLEEALAICTPEEIIESVIELITPRLASEGVELQVEYTCSDSSLVKVQKTALQQVISNLLNNSVDALQDSENPKQLRVKTFDQDGTCCICIEDNGPGVPDHLKETIFDPFVTNKSGGTGLGLSICKQIVEKNGGEIRFASRPGETQFTVALLRTAAQE